jgi:hypothetical protein
MEEWKYRIFFTILNKYFNIGVSKRCLFLTLVLKASFYKILSFIIQYPLVSLDIIPGTIDSFLENAYAETEH